MPAPKPPAKPAEVEINAKLVRQLAGILNDTDLTEIEVERGELRIRVARTSQAAPQIVHAAPPMMAAPAPQSAPAAAPASAPVMSTDPAGPAPRMGEEVKSPMVGTVYLQATPGADPFVKPGDTVKAGQTLLIVEAMKTMNPITAPRDGKVLEVLVGDAQPVEFGEALLLLE
ncbi:acetyl-CoA carboxylase biotin carboxyl carrier protein [Brevundimonas sp.]|uniref:acetyl-CoA carboxylase biotin carboxyl carrier protein n=1 Tax=Brevundimonas sp. TaxID=1871086 RepID=UPI0025F66ED6|nr:acetyl-CoA carboxylase biotin carboxyl carrier protein [Brevundimonas sp.]